MSGKQDKSVLELYNQSMRTRHPDFSMSDINFIRRNFARHLAIAVAHGHIIKIHKNFEFFLYYRASSNPYSISRSRGMIRAKSCFGIFLGVGVRRGVADRFKLKFYPDRPFRKIIDEIHDNADVTFKAIAT